MTVASVAAKLPTVAVPIQLVRLRKFTLPPKNKYGGSREPAADFVA